MVVFRDGAGRPRALLDRCAHRNMPLSLGRVADDGCLECCYHGWTFAADGAGESPGTPKLRTRADSYEAREAHGVIWVRNRGANTSTSLKVGWSLPIFAIAIMHDEERHKRLFEGFLREYEAEGKA